jgi:hypothetical protein
MIALINTHDVPAGVNWIGTVVSMHRTWGAAERADAKLQRAVKRGHGRDAYLPTWIRRVNKGLSMGSRVYKNQVIDE